MMVCFLALGWLSDAERVSFGVKELGLSFHHKFDLSL
jgi:hypothetical protein